MKQSRKMPKLNKKTTKVDLIGKTLELPTSAIGRDGKIEMIGNKEATVDGCRCVVEYSDIKITLNIGSGNVTFIGSDLEISSLSAGVAVVRGIVASVEFFI